MSDSLYNYIPGNIPNWSPEESIETYMERFLPWLQDELRRVADQFTHLPIIPYEPEAPRKPFDGMTRYFSQAFGGWTPSSSTDGPYVYMNGSWYLINLSAGVPHA